MSSRSRNFLIPAIIVAAALAIIAYLLIGGGDDEPTAAGDPEEAGQEATTDPSGVVGEVVEPDSEEKLDAERHDPEDPLAMGALDAPVTIVMFSDFQCPFCALWTAQTLPELTPYIEDEELRVEWRDLAVFGEDSRRAAYAGYAAGLQGKYLDFTQTLFDGGDSPSAGALSDDALEELAGDLGLDVEKFNADRAGEEVQDAVEANFAEGEELGVFSTPAFLINGRPIIGAQPTDTFIEAIDAELTGNE